MSALAVSAMELFNKLPESEQEFAYQFLQKLAKGYAKRNPNC